MNHRRKEFRKVENYVVQEDDLLDGQGVPNDIPFVIAKREYGDGFLKSVSSAKTMSIGT